MTMDKLQELIERGEITPALRVFNPDNWLPVEGAPIYPNAVDEFLKERHEARY